MESAGDRKINLLCVGSVGLSFFEFAKKTDLHVRINQCLLINDLSSSDFTNYFPESFLSHPIFCIAGAASSKNGLRINSIYSKFPFLWVRTKFILVHPFNFEGVEKINYAKGLSSYLRAQNSNVSDLHNQELLKYATKEMGFDEGFLLMNQWIMELIFERD